jgi:hypothetical protein
LTCFNRHLDTLHKRHDQIVDLFASA